MTRIIMKYISVCTLALIAIFSFSCQQKSQLGYKALSGEGKFVADDYNNFLGYAEVMYDTIGYQSGNERIYEHYVYIYRNNYRQLEFSDSTSLLKLNDEPFTSISFTLNCLSKDNIEGEFNASHASNNANSMLKGIVDIRTDKANNDLIYKYQNIELSDGTLAISRVKDAYRIDFKGKGNSVDRIYNNATEDMQETNKKSNLDASFNYAGKLNVLRK